MSSVIPVNGLRGRERPEEGGDGGRRGPALGTEFRTLGLAEEQWEGTPRFQGGKDVVGAEVWKTRSGLRRENDWKEGKKGSREERGASAAIQGGPTEGAARAEREKLILETAAARSTAAATGWMREPRDKETEADGATRRDGELGAAHARAGGSECGTPEQGHWREHLGAGRDSQREATARHLGAEK